METEHNPDRPVVLTIAGFDPSSGAGITADLKTIAAHGCFGVACITALTVQSTQGVRQVAPVDANVVRDTLNELAADVTIGGIRIGMLGSAEVATAVADFLEQLVLLPAVVLDPVLVASSGAKLLDDAGVEVLRKRLLPLCTVVTPNLPEAITLTGLAAETPADQLAHALQDSGAKFVIITGGHSDSNDDLLATERGETVLIPGEKVRSQSTHGTGCAYSAALACNLALGKDLTDAARQAKEYVAEAIRQAYSVGKGKGPLHHLYKLDERP